jgi:hypothetical protein
LLQLIRYAEIVAGQDRAVVLAQELHRLGAQAFTGAPETAAGLTGAQKGIDDASGNSFA